MINCQKDARWKYVLACLSGRKAKFSEWMVENKQIMKNRLKNESDEETKNVMLRQSEIYVNCGPDEI